MSEISRLKFLKPSIEDAYAEPSNWLEIDVLNPKTHGEGRNRYTDYEICMRVCRNSCWRQYLDNAFAA
jgi:sorting nexin-3/12